MKKSISFFLFACIFFNPIFSQITKKNWLVGGNGTFLSSKSESSSATSITSSRTLLRIEPNIGYFFIDQFVGGIQGVIDYEKLSVGSTNNSGTYYSIGPFLRYYFLKKEKEFNIFSETSYSHLFSGNNSSGSNTYSIALGAVLFFNSSVGLEFIPRYSITKNNDLTYKNFQLALGFQIHLLKEK